jgi:nitroreductase
MHPYADMIYQASFAILVCGDLKLEKIVEYIVQDCSAATQNILLSAHALGLGAVWLGVYPREERTEGLKKLFYIPKHIIPVSLISCGYPAEKIPPEIRYNQTRIHVNKF